VKEENGREGRGEGQNKPLSHEARTRLGQDKELIVQGLGFRVYTRLGPDKELKVQGLGFGV